MISSEVGSEIRATVRRRFRAVGKLSCPVKAHRHDWRCARQLFIGRPPVGQPLLTEAAVRLLAAQTSGAGVRNLLLARPKLPMRIALTIDAEEEGGMGDWRDEETEQTIKGLRQLKAGSARFILLSIKMEQHQSSRGMHVTWERLSPPTSAMQLPH